MTQFTVPWRLKPGSVQSVSEAASWGRRRGVTLSIDPDDELFERTGAHVQDLLALVAVDVLKLDRAKVDAILQVGREVSRPNWVPRAAAGAPKVTTEWGRLANGGREGDPGPNPGFVMERLESQVLEVWELKDEHQRGATVAGFGAEHQGGQGRA